MYIVCGLGPLKEMALQYWVRCVNSVCPGMVFLKWVSVILFC